MSKIHKLYNFAILGVLALAATAAAQQTIPPFSTPYGNFATGIKLQGSFGAVGLCPVSTGTGTVWSTCPGMTQLTGDVLAGPGSGSQVATLATVNGSPGTCGDGSHVCQITTNGKGLTTSQTQVALTGGITQLTGDGLAGPGTGSQVLTLATVNAGPGACGDATHVCQVTTNGKGLTTSQTQVAITSGITELTGDAAAGPGTGSQAITFATVNGAPGTCGDSTHVCQITTNGKGLTTSQTPVAIGAFNLIATAANFTSCTLGDDGTGGSGCTGTQAWSNSITGSYIWGCSVARGTWSCPNAGNCESMEYVTVSQTGTDFTYALNSRVNNGRTHTITMMCWAIQ